MAEGRLGPQPVDPKEQEEVVDNFVERLQRKVARGEKGKGLEAGFVELVELHERLLEQNAAFRALSKDAGPAVAQRRLRRRMGSLVVTEKERMLLSAICKLCDHEGFRTDYTPRAKKCNHPELGPAALALLRTVGELATLLKISREVIEMLQHERETAPRHNVSKEVLEQMRDAEDFEGILGSYGFQDPLGHDLLTCTDFTNLTNAYHLAKAEIRSLKRSVNRWITGTTVEGDYVEFPEDQFLTKEGRP